MRRTGSIDGLGDTGDLTDDEPLDGPIEQQDDELERMADAAFEQLELREEYLGADYPFAVNGALAAKPGAPDTVYAFLTTATLLGSRSDAASESVASLFEIVSRSALVCYLGGPATARGYDFGFPRRDGPKAFYDAVEALCQQLGEGLGCRVPRPQSAHVKDAKLDVVAWIPFGDRRTNQLSVFGQCATGSNWRDKLTELLPEAFCKRWFREQPAATPSSAFFVPRHIEERYWPEAAVGDQRILFDRLRIVRVLVDIDEDLANRCATWTASVLD